MECCICGSKSTMVFDNEIIPCHKCGESINLEYYSCRDCGAVWKALDGNLLECIYTEDERSEAPVDLKEILNNDDFGSVQVIELTKRGTMDEMIHKCLMCNTVSYEVAAGLFHCPDCGFEWEVI